MDWEKVGRGRSQGRGSGNTCGAGEGVVQTGRGLEGVARPGQVGRDPGPRGLWHLLLRVLERFLGCSRPEPRAAMALRAVIFDLDGVLALPSFAGALTSTEEALALPRYGCPVPGAGSCCRGPRTD